MLPLSCAPCGSMLRPDAGRVASWAVAWLPPAVAGCAVPFLHLGGRWIHVLSLLIGAQMCRSQGGHLPDHALLGAAGHHQPLGAGGAHAGGAGREGWLSLRNRLGCFETKCCGARAARLGGWQPVRHAIPGSPAHARLRLAATENPVPCFLNCVPLSVVVCSRCGRLSWHRMHLRRWWAC